MARLICWYSHGAASLIAAKKAIEMQPEKYPDHEIVVACIYIQDELHEPHRDKIVEKFLGHKITYLFDIKYNSSVDTVIEKTRYMSGVNGARCTKELKKAVRISWQKDDDVHVFGFDCKEAHRTDQVLDTEPELEIFTPLVELGMTKKDCFVEMRKVGIELPKMYRLGYHNNNCCGCVKASGAGYWNKIRVDFPAVFEKRDRQSYLLNVKLVRLAKTDVDKYGAEIIAKAKLEGLELTTTNDGRMRIPLRYLPEGAGTHKDLDIGDCGIVCEMKG